MVNLAGIERLQAHLLADIYKLIEKYDAAPKALSDCQNWQDIISKMSLGQLLTMANIDDRIKGLTLHSRDDEGTVYLTIGHCSGGMDTEGFIHT